jgi:hypothetical protein
VWEAVVFELGDVVLEVEAELGVEFPFDASSAEEGR